MPSRAKKHRGVGWLLALAGFLALLFFLSTGSRGFIRQIQVRRQKARLEQEIAQLKEQIAVLEEEKKKLHDAAEIERIAREDYGMARENEKVYRVVPKED
ncbi:MAG TPA: septum formation initiator family protein [bacterium]|nr:septum formation initiator family protein [bacterium]